MADPNKESGSRSGAPKAAVPPFRGPVARSASRPGLRPISPAAGRETLPPFTSGLRFAAARPATRVEPTPTGAPAPPNPLDSGPHAVRGAGVHAASSVEGALDTTQSTPEAPGWPGAVSDVELGGYPPAAGEATRGEGHTATFDTAPAHAHETDGALPSILAYLGSEAPAPAPSSPAEGAPADLDALFGPDPFQEPAAGPLSPAPETEIDPFGDMLDSIPEPPAANRASDSSDDGYLVPFPVPAEVWPPPGVALGAIRTPAPGADRVPEEPWTEVPGAARRSTPITGGATSAEALPAGSPTPPRPATPVDLRSQGSAGMPDRRAMPTPITVPALPDMSAARSIAEALESVAAQIRAGQLTVSGTPPAGDGVDARAAMLAVALTALLGVRR